jgi:hypothetical protein
MVTDFIVVEAVDLAYGIKTLRSSILPASARAAGPCGCLSAHLAHAADYRATKVAEEVNVAVTLIAEQVAKVGFCEKY